MNALVVSNKTRQYRTRIADVWYQDNIMYINILPGVEITLADAIESTELGKMVTNGAQFCLCIDIRKIRSINHDARAHFSSKEKSSKTLAVGLIADNPLSCIIANFFLGFNKPKKPLRIFNSRLSAEAWLKCFTNFGEGTIMNRQARWATLH